jgi:ElaB/YqjD/DUF883 family membrane-anchored ribosome-binding protein
MVRKPLLLLALLAAPVAAHLDSGKLIAIRNIRTVAAEAALVADLKQHGRVSDTYAREMRQDAKDELESLRKQVEQKNPDLLPITQQAIDATQAADIGRLRAIANQLLAMEGPHGRAD